VNFETEMGDARDHDRLERPIFVVGSPRSGTTLLQNLLCRDPSVFKLGRESRFLWHRIGGQEVTGVFPDQRHVASEYLSEAYRGERAWTPEEQRRWALRSTSQGMPAQYLDLPHDLIEALRTNVVGPFAESVQTETAPFTLPPLDATWATDTDGPVRIVDKDTGHCWRLPELAHEFPDAQFVFVVREPQDAIRSLVAGWRHPTWFFTYRLTTSLNITGYSDFAPWGKHWWNFNLFPGWEGLVDAPLEEVASQQWGAAISPVADHGIPLIKQGRAIVTTYEQIVSEPHGTLGAIAEFTGLNADALIGNGLDRNYMSMSASTFDPGSGDIRSFAERVRSLMDPLAQYLDLGSS
jgi:hypothetical protein